MVNRSKIGLRGELIVHDALPSSHFINDERDIRRPYDLVWNGIKIGVKTTVRTKGRKELACVFSPNLHSRSNGVVVVFVGLIDDAKYFWVEKASENIRSYFKVKDALTEAALPQAIRRAQRMEVEAVTTGGGHEVICVLLETKKDIQRVRMMPHMLREDGLPRSIPVVVDEVIDFYIEAHQKGRK